MATTRWQMSNTAVFNVAYHLIWCPKYRKAILTGAVEKRLKQLLLDKASENGWQIETMEVMPDHVHLFVRANPVASPHWIIQQFKGYTSNVLRKEFPELKSKLPTLWTRSYYCESVGHLSEDAVKKYIADQKGK